MALFYDIIIYYERDIMVDKNELGVNKKYKEEQRISVCGDEKGNASTNFAPQPISKKHKRILYIVCIIIVLSFFLIAFLAWQEEQKKWCEGTIGDDVIDMSYQEFKKEWETNLRFKQALGEKVIIKCDYRS